MDSTVVDTTTAVIGTLAPWTLPLISVAGIIKVTAFLKWLVNEKLKWNVGSYGGWILVIMVAFGWTAISKFIEGGQLDGETFKQIATLAFEAIFGYGLAVNGFLGSPGKRLATKPIL
jgi:hypothetical protein